MDSTTKIEINDEKITFYKKGWNQCAEVDNLPEIRNYIEKYQWIDNNGYLYCHKLKKYLHRLVIELKIGRDELVKLTKQGFVVDHINNSERYNCSYDNLHLIPSDINKAKGLTVDKDIERIRLRAGIGLYVLKDDQYQIGIGFNERTVLWIGDRFVDLVTLHLNYNNFDFFYNDLQRILTWLKGKNGCQLDFSTLQYTHFSYEEMKHIQLTKEEQESGGCFLERDGQIYLRINNRDPNRFVIIHKPAKKE